MKSFFYILFILFLTACKNNKQEAQGEWIKGTEKEKIKTIENQFRGFDNAMVETGYRYQELYWAGQDENWEYATYQLDKIKTAIDNGLQRRPKRAASAQSFLNTAIPAMKESINKKDTAAFNRDFIIFQSACQSCHIAEKVAFIQQKIPDKRLSPIKFSKE